MEEKELEQDLKHLLKQREQALAAHLDTMWEADIVSKDAPLLVAQMTQ